ncbi:unnamed protein product [Rotaria sordida]|uniref:UV excision repair protein RAD23 n=1 Tax=Rotaria sordida TaxID=392033 RepID=A0A814W875_9BILA|nr:unnamed protein product [Rotaria sordida]CAF1199622.1 unnamed protein product [Rotaria sordida]CAF1314905.1 unnamed protein product [Rotaria sordida]CAF3665868.1 unnamed protein product [Rotaria sordida]CAF3685784.1 unnamed protein product [Rotaria sordida]
MQLQIKNLHNESFTVDCNKEDTVKVVKENIAAKNDLREKYDADLLKLLCKGKVMDDEDTIESFNIPSDGYLVLVKQTPGKPKPPPKKKPNQGFNNFGGFNSSFGMGQMPNSFMQSPFGQDPFMQQSFQPHSFMQSPFQANSFGQNAFSQHAIRPQTHFQPQAHYPPQTQYQPHHQTGSTTTPGASAHPSASERDEALQTLLAMGFDREQSEKALRASAYTPELAIEFITSGNIPETNDEPDLPPAPTPEVPPVQPNPAAAFHPGAGMNLQQIGQMLEQNPQQLQVIKNALRAEHPEMARMIDDDPQGFINLLRQAGEGGGSQSPLLGHGAGAGTGTTGGAGQSSIKVELSFPEQQIINRIQDMGFDRNRVMEAFLACDRNEEMAVNYLLHAYD